MYPNLAKYSCGSIASLAAERNWPPPPQKKKKGKITDCQLGVQHHKIVVFFLKAVPASKSTLWFHHILSTYHLYFMGALGLHMWISSAHWKSVNQRTDAAALAATATAATTIP